MNTALRRLLLVSIVLALPGAARAQIGIPCEPGTASGNGFKPCTPCEPGTFAEYSGQVECQPCPIGSFAPDPGAAECTPCGCNDGIPCSHDGCLPISGICGSTIDPSCTPVTIGFTGTVTSLQTPQSAGSFPLGSPVEGFYVIDPLAPDAQPTAPNYASYPGAVLEFAIRAGAPGAEIEATATSGDVYVANDDPGYDDYYEVRILEPAGMGVDPGSAEFNLLMRGIDASFFDSDALPAGPINPLVHDYHGIRFLLANDFGAYSEDFALVVPEPGAGALPIAALAGLAALACRRLRARA